MKQLFKKFIFIIITSIMVFNFIFPTITAFALDSDAIGVDGAGVTWKPDIASWFDDESAGEVGVDIGSTILDGIIGIRLYGDKLLIYSITKVIYIALSALTGSKAKLTPDDIIFSGAEGATDIDLVNIDFFNTNTTGVVSTIKEGISQWYYALRNLAIIVSLVILIYVGIRMAISSVASEKAKYKQMLKDWLFGFAMLFILHYLMVIVIAVNKELVTIIFNMVGGSSTNTNNLRELANGAELLIFDPMFLRSFGALIIYVIIAGISLAYFLQYVKRFFTIGFLITISPLITITYSIDKMGDGKSQALNVWLREFMFNVLIQPFHCIIYSILCTTAVAALASESSLKSVVVAIAALLFVHKAEDIVKNIFGFKAGSMENAAAAGALAWGVVSKFQSGKEKAAKAAGKVGGGSGGQSAKDMKRRNVLRATSTRNSTSTNNVPFNSQAVNSKVGKVAGKVGEGLGKTGSAIADSKFGKFVKGVSPAFSEALGDYINEKAQDFHQFEADPKDALARAGKKAWQGIGAVGGKVMPKVITGAFVGGMTGNLGTAVAAGVASDGTKLTRNLQEIRQKDLDKLVEDSKLKRLANAMDDYRINHGGDDGLMTDQPLSDEELYNKCLDLYDADIPTLPEDERRLAKRLQEMRDYYDGKGVQDVAGRVMGKVSDIEVNGQHHTIQIRTDNLVKAAEKLQADTSMPKSRIISQDSSLAPEFTDNIMDEINRYGSDYFKLGRYSLFNDAQKEYAKEVYKYKNIMSSLITKNGGTTSQDKIDEEIRRALNERLH